MNQEVKKEWLAALRDPNAKQIKGRLGIDDGRCCLGVLCDVGVERGVIPEPQLFTSMGKKCLRYDGLLQVLPGRIVAWAELGQEVPVIPGESRTLASLNDSGKTFSEIADIIEKLF